MKEKICWVLFVVLFKNYNRLKFTQVSQNDKRKFNGEGKQLSKQVSKSMLKFFRELDGENPTDIYNMVLKEVEQPLLEIVMKECNYNQSKASKVLGINRGTLRTKLKEYKLL